MNDNADKFCDFQKEPVRAVPRMAETGAKYEMSKRNATLIPTAEQLAKHPDLVKESNIAPDMINHPPHYKSGGIEVIDFIEAKKFNYNLGNAIKYISRSGLKGDALEDLMKAKWYIEREIQHLKGN